MTTTSSDLRGPVELRAHGFTNTGRVWWNPSVPTLYEHATAIGQGRLAEGGPLVVDTGKHTGRSPKDKFVVREPGSEDRIWWGEINKSIDEAAFRSLRSKALAYLQGRDLYVVDAWGGTDPEFRMAVRVVTPSPYHAMFARTMFVDPTEDEIREHRPEALVLHAPGFQANSEVDGTRSETAILLHPSEGEILVAGTWYAGEIKKSIFTLLNDRLPLRGVLPMHCSANVGDDGRVAIFFGLSGTGKTTLSADPTRTLIGDDEHGWSDHGVFNFEGGCYAKTIRLSAEAEPEIYATTRMFGTILENVVMDERGRLDLDDASKTENTRAAYPISFIPNAHPEGRAGHPANVIMLTADAFGILPPVARLTPEQAAFYFLCGYTAKVAGTEIGVKEPQATFSTCFGAPFIPQYPSRYATMLSERLQRHDADVWLVNTGWTGGPYGEGHRMPIAATRAILHAALGGGLHDAAYRTDPVFGVEVPTHVPGVDDELLDPRGTWRDPDAYDAKAAELAEMFERAFDPFRDRVGPEVAEAGPRGAGQRV